ncbi:hypothetical protein OIU76_015003 [Salix suchowensis]|nr:hypothetical protein OIU76_015003 [Salix suchowensis]
MEQRVLFLSFSSLLLLSFSGSVDAYKNYTVGDSLGWYDTTVKSNVDYQKWADGKNFSLGDFLTLLFHSWRELYLLNYVAFFGCKDKWFSTRILTIQWFRHTISPHTSCVILTIPWTTTPWNGHPPIHPTLSRREPQWQFPLLKEGPNYFFSGDYDGEQCDNGQHFKITVSHGKGLPDSLKDPSDQAPAPECCRL